ncbi:helix-turn-helix domain-containing protein [Streptomyces fumanus]|uniref:helix-turn-helix domain-containing protein n=1 Tax=Streptomyces fumanus TaxID=67302 RepID=UPI0033F0B998
MTTAAAREFDRHGYAGTSLTRIASSAGISVGALTFHYANKRELADAVRRKAHADTVPAVGRAAARQADPVEAVVLLTLTLAELLEREVAVRAAARLSREQPGPLDWTSAWTPTLRECLPDHPGETAGAGPDPAALASLATYLVTGVEAEIRRRIIHQEESAEQARVQLARIWTVVLQGLSPSA